MSLLHNPHSPLIRTNALKSPPPDHFSLPQQQRNPAIREDREERRHAQTPAKPHPRNPIRHKERQCQTERQAKQAHDCSAFTRVTLEAFDYVVDSHGNQCVGGETAKEVGQREDHVVEVVLECGAVEAQGDREDDEAGEPEGVKPVLRFPDAGVVAAADVEGEAVVEEGAVDLGGDDAEPEAEED